MKEFPPGAACQELPHEVVDEYFFEAVDRNHQAKIKMAKRICANCFVRSECYEAVMSELPPYGLQAGMTPRERDRELTRLNGGDAA